MLKLGRSGAVLALASCVLALLLLDVVAGDDLPQQKEHVVDDKSAKLEKQVQLQQKQIQTLEKMVELLTEQAKKPAAPAALDDLAERTAILESRLLQSARRDQDLARAVDDIFERQDNERRLGPQWPANLKQLYLPSQTNQTPLSIYGVLTGGYTDLGNQVPNFDADLSTFFLLTLNDQFLLEAELEFTPEGVELGQAQVDWILNDWSTLVLGRFLTPLGIYNERLHSTWINKLPDNPLVFRQVVPTDYSQNGVQLRGGMYLWDSPLKLEYSAFVSNGLGVPGTGLDPTTIANLNELRETVDNVNNGLAYGGRLGFWLPEYGLTWGISGLINGAYTEDTSDDLKIWQLDAAWRKGNWEVRGEYGELHQDAAALIGSDIVRRGLYAQMSYRPYDSYSPFWQKWEWVFRYSFANFHGIDPGALELDEFASTVDLPVDRHQYTMGVAYWLYPSLALKFAYQINDEVGTEYRDNGLLAQFAWGF